MTEEITMNKLELYKDQEETLEQYPNLNKYVNSFIENEGYPEETGHISNLVYFFKRMCIDNNLNEEELFQWTKEEADDFYTWGHNSRWANMFAYYLECNFNKCISIALALAKRYGDINLGKEN